MEWLDDAKACLDVARTMLDDVEELINQSIQHEDVVPYLKVSIKNCLENCRSPLDYAANYIFDTYCRSEYASKTEIDNKRATKPQFPITKKPEGFKGNMKNKFKNLSYNHPEIYTIFEKAQPFNGYPWLDNLTVLVNKNKHRNLTKHTKEQTTHIKKGYLGGNTFIDVIMEDVGVPIEFGNTKIDFINPSPYDHLFDATVKFEYLFSDLKLQVIPTLFSIYQGASSVINELEKVLEGN